MFSALRILLDHLIGEGDLVVIDADGATHRFGDGTGPRVGLRFLDRRTERAIALDPQLALGEAWMDGRIEMVEGGIYDLLALVMREIERHPVPRWVEGLDIARKAARRLAQMNSTARARRNVAHHYDIDGRIYDLFLDQDRQYSCGYFTPGADLEAAQLAKKRHIAAKLALKPGHRVLDIGAGWGGLGLYLAETAGADVTGVTLSAEQLGIARERAAAMGLGCGGALRARGLQARHRHIRSHRVGRHVRACRRQPLRCLFREGCRPAGGRRRRADPLDRPLRRAGLHQSVHRALHLPRRLFPGVVGSAAGGRARGTDRCRRRDPAPALCRDAAGVARAVHGAPGRGGSAQGRALRADVGVLPGGIRGRLPPAGPRRVPAPARQGGRRPAV